METEKQLTLKTTWVHVRAQITDGTAQGTVDNCIPLTDPTETLIIPKIMNG